MVRVCVALMSGVLVVGCMAEGALEEEIPAGNQAASGRDAGKGDAKADASADAKQNDAPESRDADAGEVVDASASGSDAAIDASSDVAVGDGAVSPTPSVVQVSAGYLHSCAVRSDGSESSRR